MAVQIRNLRKRIGGKTIIDGLTFDIPYGEVFGFLGPNGSGKTTTIRMMVGLMSMTDGEVRIGGFSVTSHFEKAMAQVGAIVENPELYKFMTGYQNLAHYARMMPGITKERIQEVIELVRLEKRIHDKVGTYSLGMRQRLGVAQAILHRPSVLILDEPTNGLDPEGIHELRVYLRDLAKRENTAVIVSSHLLSEMELMCDRVMIIQKGRLVDVRTIKTVDSEDTADAVLIRWQVDDAIRAAGLMKDYPGLQTEAGGSLLVRLNREQIPELNAALAAAGVRVYGIGPGGQTLEETFLQLTRGESLE